MAHVRLTINGQQFEHDVEPRLLLIHYIRQYARFTGPHIGCDTGNCGACTILWNGQPIKSCLALAVQAQGAEILTIEGLAEDGAMHPLQQAFVDNFGVQCGYCTPGMIMSALGLLRSNPSPSEADIREALEGNLCMCTGYQQIVEAIDHAAGAMRDGQQ